MKKDKVEKRDSDQINYDMLIEKIKKKKKERKDEATKENKDIKDENKKDFKVTEMYCLELLI